MKFKFLTLKGDEQPYENVEFTGEKMELYGKIYYELKTFDKPTKWNGWIDVEEIVSFSLFK